MTLDPEIKIQKPVTAMSRESTRPVPMEWGHSELTQFLNIAEENAIASFVHFPDWINALEKIDQNLVVGSRDFFHAIDAERRFSSSLFMRSFGTFRAAVRLTMSGQIYESTILVRSILESATYAWVCAHSREHREGWQKRGASAEDLKAAKKLFQWTGLIKMLRTVDEETAEQVEKLYQQTIDFGAHPNVEGVFLSNEIKQVDEFKFEINTIFLHGANGFLLAVLDLSRAMELVYRLLALTISDRLRILGIDQQVDEERHFVIDLINKLEHGKSVQNE